MWNEDQRQILKIELSGRVHHLDPLPVLRRYRTGVRKMGDEIFTEALKSALEGDETPQLADAFYPILYEIMAWKPFDADNAEGYTQGEVLAGLTQFLGWLVESKKKGETSPFSAISAGDSAATPPTPSTADSSSADPSSNPEGPGSTPSAAG
jgi:hypothetical protein